MASWNPSSSVKLLKQGSDASARPVWVMPVFSGITSCFDRMFNSYDGFKRTVYGLNDPYLTGNDDALTAAFDDWVGMYVAAMKTKQAEGPYTLMGYSQGMHWCWAIAEHLRKKFSDTCDDIIILDPNFPAWSKADRVLAWDGPQMSKKLGMPLCILKMIFGGFIKAMNKNARWETAASREATVAKAVAEQTTGVDDYETMSVAH